MIPLTKYSTYFLDVNRAASLNRYALFFDSLTGTYLFSLKYNRTVIVMLPNPPIDSEELTTLSQRGGTWAEMEYTANQISLGIKIDIDDDFLGALIRVVYAEMQNGNSVDMGIVAESVINRWLRREEKLYHIRGKKAQSYKDIIESPAQYQAISRVDRDTKLVIYENLISNYETLLDQGKVKESILNAQLTTAVSVSIRAHNYNQINLQYFGVTNYVTYERDNPNKYTSSYYDSDYNYVDLINEDSSLTKIKGNKSVVDAACHV